MILHEAAGAAPSASDEPGHSPPSRPLPWSHRRRVCERPLSDRTARTQPVRRSRPTRCAMALRALAHTASRMNPRAVWAGPVRPGHVHSARTELGAVADSSCLGATGCPAPAGSDHRGAASAALRDDCRRLVQGRCRQDHDRALLRALCRARTDDPFLPMEGRGHHERSATLINEHKIPANGCKVAK